MVHNNETLLTADALNDYEEYRANGGRYSIDTWWYRYADNYITPTPIAGQMELF